MIIVDDKLEDDHDEHVEHTQEKAPSSGVGGHWSTIKIIHFYRAQWLFTLDLVFPMDIRKIAAA